MKPDLLEPMFREYLKSSNAPYAILINGEWGSGKTFFWKQRLKKIADTDGYKTAYLSLNGISKIEALEQQLFIRLVPLANDQDKKYVKKLTDITASIVKAVDKSFLKGGLSELLKGVGLDAFSFENYIICFDDFERCGIDAKELLGFINNYIEHRGLKALILSDEAQVPNQKDYARIKEKVIGRIWNFEPDIPSTLRKQVEVFKTRNPNHYRFLQIHLETIQAVVINYKIVNLRIVSFCLSILENLQPHLKNVKKEFIRETIFFIVIISNEFKGGRLKSTDSEDYKQLDNLENYIFSKKVSESLSRKKVIESDVAKGYEEEFYDKYLGDKMIPYTFSSTIYAYILSGFLDERKFKDELTSRDPIKLPDHVLAYRSLINYKFRELDDADFKLYLDKVIDYAKKGWYSIYDYVGIAAFLYYFSKNGIANLSNSDVKSIIDNGLTLSKKRKDQFNEAFIANLIHFQDSEIEVEGVKGEVRRIHDELRNERLTEMTSTFIRILESEDEFALGKAFESHNLKVELLPFIDVDELFNALTKISNKQLFNFTQLLENRYKVSNIGEFLFDDHAPLLVLLGKLDSHLTSSNLIQPGRFLMETLRRTIDEICTHLMNTRRP